jgi:hypothetical protein
MEGGPDIALAEFDDLRRRRGKRRNRYKGDAIVLPYTPEGFRGLSERVLGKRRKEVEAAKPVLSILREFDAALSAWNSEAHPIIDATGRQLGFHEQTETGKLARSLQFSPQ